MERIENRMLREAPFEREVSEKRLDGAGWVNIKTDVFVRDEDAFNYAIDQCTIFVPPEFHKIEWTQEFKEMLVEWFYSCGEWRKEN